MEPAKKGGAFVTLDMEKLGPDEHLIIGEINACDRWSKAFLSMRLKSNDPIERQFLSEVAAALKDDAEAMGVRLAVEVQRKGMGKVHNVPGHSDVSVPSIIAPSTETKQ